MLWKCSAPVCVLTIAVFIASTIVSAQQNPAAQQGPSESEKAAAKAAWPKDVDRNSGQRLPLPKREDMNEEGKKIYDQLVGNNGITTGPLAVQMYSPKYQWLVRQVNTFLRTEAESGLNPHVQEVAILVGCREAHADYEWNAHEAAAKRAGVDQKVIDAIRNRSSLTGLPEGDAAIIQLGREIFGPKRVSSETFARVHKIYDSARIVNIVGLMSFYFSVAGQIHTFGQEMPAGQKPLLPAEAR
jgi:4-carboxymuconolactone decarboxylase